MEIIITPNRASISFDIRQVFSSICGLICLNAAAVLIPQILNISCVMNIHNILDVI